MKTKNKTHRGMRWLAVTLVALLAAGLLLFGAMAEETSSAAFSKYSLTLNENIDINFYVIAEDGVTPTVAFSYRGVTSSPIEGETQDDGSIRFTFAGVTPQYLDEDVTATLYVDDAEIATQTVCAADYLVQATGQSWEATAAALKQYGAAAKWYLGKTEKPSLEGLPEKDGMSVAAEKSLGTNPDTVKAEIQYAGLVLDRTVRMYFDFLVTDDTLTAPAVALTVDDNTVTVENAELTKTSDGYLRATVDIKASELLESVVTATVLDENDASVSATATYSVTAYLKAYADYAGDDGQLATLVKSIYTYAVMAKDYGAGHPTKTSGNPVAPTCTAAGYTPATCDVCGYETRTEGDPATGHGKLVQTLAADNSSVTYACSDCGDGWTSEVLRYALGDSFSHTLTPYNTDATTYFGGAPTTATEESGNTYYTLNRNTTTGKKSGQYTFASTTTTTDATARMGVVSIKMKAPESAMSSGWTLRLMNKKGSDWGGSASYNTSETVAGTDSFHCIYNVLTSSDGKTVKGLQDNAKDNAKLTTLATLSSDVWTRIDIVFTKNSDADTITLAYYVNGTKEHTAVLRNVLAYNTPCCLFFAPTSTASTETVTNSFLFDDLMFAYTDTARESFLQHEHTYDAGAVTAPTCTEAGYTTYVCTSCGETVIDDEVAALGHGTLTSSVTDGQITYACSREGCTYAWASEGYESSNVANTTYTGVGSNWEPQISNKGSAVDSRVSVFTIEFQGAPGAEWNFQLYNRASGGTWSSAEQYAAGTSWGLHVLRIDKDGNVYSVRVASDGSDYNVYNVTNIGSIAEEKTRISVVITKDVTNDNVIMDYYVDGVYKTTQTTHNYLINDTPYGIYSKVKVPTDTQITVGEFSFAYTDTARESFLLPTEE